MKSLDLKEKEKIELKQELQAAIASGNEESMAKAMVKFADNIQQGLIQEYNTLSAHVLNDQEALKARGIQPLTKEEREYYMEVIEGHGFENVEKLVPPTVINRVFDELVREHPFLSEIDFNNVGPATHWIVKNGEVPTAWWGKLTDKIKELFDDGFKVIATNLFKLSAFIPVHKSMLDLGPQWLDRYVRTVLLEAGAIGLEEGGVNGTGIEMPIGMKRNMENFNTATGYPEKSSTPLTDLSPETMGKEIMAKLTRDGKRKVSKVLIVVNPWDYWTKIFPATTMLTPQGSYISGVLPIPATIVQSVSMEKGKMVAGIGKDYFMGVGSAQKIESSDEHRFLDDQRVYLMKQYANGRPKDNDSFYLFDISNLGTSLKP